MTIPVFTLVQVNPSVLSPGGSNFVLNGLALTENKRFPMGTVQPFPTAAAVGAYAGLGSAEYAFALIYFAGYIGSTKKPGQLLIAQYPYNGAVAAYNRGASIGTTTAQINQSLMGFQNINSGSFSITIDGGVYSPTGVNLSSANSLANVASLVQAAV